MNCSRIAAAAFGALILILSPRFAAVAKAQVVTATADAHITDNVRDPRPNNFNFGSMNYLLVQNDPLRAYKAYLRFNLTPLVLAGGVGVKSAHLALNFSRFRDPAAPDVREADTISVYGITDNNDLWNEGVLKGADHPTDITFNNAPRNDKSSAMGLLDARNTDGAAVRLLGSFPVPRDAASTAEMRLDIAPFINWALRGGRYGAAPRGDADKIVTLILVHTGGNENAPNNGVQFFSRENTAGPGAANVPALAPRLQYVLETRPAVLKGTVATVVDAETLVVRGIGNVRLAGISALRDPRRKPLPDDDVFGDEADRAMRRLAAGRQVQIAFEGQGKDVRGAAIGWVFLADGTLLNEQLVRRGYAKVTTLPVDSQYNERLRNAERQARAARRGLWPKQK